MTTLSTTEERRTHFADSYRPLLLPEADSFFDVLAYCGEWPKHGQPGPFVSPRYVPEETPEATAWEREAWHGPDGRNKIGPYCTVDLSQLDGPRHRGMAVQATDATIAAVRDRIVTPDDTMTFKIVGHKGTGRALVILEHGYIIGSHWLAYIDPATIPEASR